MYLDIERVSILSKNSRESFLRQSLRSIVELGDLVSGLREALILTGTKVIDNLKPRKKMSRRTHGHCVEVVAV